MDSWEVQNSSTLPLEVQAGQRVEIWTPANKASEEMPGNKNYALYFCVSFHDLQRILLSGWDTSSPLAQLLWKRSRCLSLTKYDIGSTGPPYKEQLRTNEPFKGYIPR